MYKIILDSVLFVALITWTTTINAQITLQGNVSYGSEKVSSALMEFKNVVNDDVFHTQADPEGNFTLTINPGDYNVQVKATGFTILREKITVKESPSIQQLNFELVPISKEINEVVISGTMLEVSKLNSVVPVDVYTERFFKTNPTNSVFEGLSQVNGVRPQVNCNVCNTGDIHINGLEGPYTMVLIDGMPIVSGLSSVYGFSGIPQSLISRVEVVRGPASTLYGSEAVGGLINIITKKPTDAPLFAFDVFGTTWGELSADASSKFNVGKKAQSLLGVNYFNYQQKFDKNNDGFTDLTLQDRISVFNKWNFDRKDGKLFSVAGRYVYEDRWGGEMNWKPEFRGTDSVYGESIYTNRWEIFGTYELPVKEKILLQFSGNGHNQNSAYGDEIYIADQYIGFGQLVWNKNIGRNNFLFGGTYRYTYYDDNTPATETVNVDSSVTNRISHTHLPGIFIQDEISITENNKLLLGIRYDNNSKHGSIFSPRVNYKWNSPDQTNVVRIGFGNGYRVANVFTEDHAALTGARDLVFKNDLKPETSWNGNINYVKYIPVKNGNMFSIDATAFYTYFMNQIIPDYETNVNQIIYDNLDGHAVSQGFALNVDYRTYQGLNIRIGATIMDVYVKENGKKEQQLFTEKFSGVWNIGYNFNKMGISIDYTGNLYGPMRLPLISEHDPRPEFSPWWSIQNIQITKRLNNGVEIYGGVKNLLNWTPFKNLRDKASLIPRTNDPFDKNVSFDDNDIPLVTADNPYGLVFSPEYVYASNQGIRAFLGVRWNF